jgi:hypothetical protein
MTWVMVTLVIAQLMAHLSEAERDAAWTEIEESMRQFEGADGFLVPQTYLIGVGTSNPR